MSEHAQAILALIMDVAGPLLLGIALIYGVIVASRRRRSRAAEQARDAATRDLYREDNR